MFLAGGTRCSCSVLSLFFFVTSPLLRLFATGGTWCACSCSNPPLPLWSILLGPTRSRIWPGLNTFYPEIIPTLNVFTDQKGLFLSMTVPAILVLMGVIVSLILAFSLAHWLAYHNTVNKDKLFQERFQQIWRQLFLGSVVGVYAQENYLQGQFFQPICWHTLWSIRNILIKDEINQIISMDPKTLTL